MVEKKKFLSEFLMQVKSLSTLYLRFIFQRFNYRFHLSNRSRQLSEDWAITAVKLSISSFFLVG